MKTLITESNDSCKLKFFVVDGIKNPCRGNRLWLGELNLLVGFILNSDL